MRPLIGAAQNTAQNEVPILVRTHRMWTCTAATVTGQLASCNRNTCATVTYE